MPVIASKIPYVSGIEAVVAANQQFDLMEAADTIKARYGLVSHSAGALAVHTAPMPQDVRPPTIPRQNEGEAESTHLDDAIVALNNTASTYNTYIAEKLADYRDSLRKAPKGWYEDMDARLDSEPVPDMFVRGKELASKDAGRDLAWSEWLAGDTFYGDVTSTQPFTAISDEQLLHLFQWNIHRAEQLNTDPEIQQRIQKVTADIHTGLQRAVDNMQLSPALLRRAKQIAPIVRIMDPLNGRQLECEATYYSHLNTMLIDPNFRESTFVHETMHAYGGFARKYRTEAYADLIAMEIAPEHRQAYEKGVYEDEILLARLEMKASGLSLRDVSAIMIGHDREMNESVLNATMLQTCGLPIAQMVDAMYDKHHKQAIARGESERSAYRTALRETLNWFAGALVPKTQESSQQ